MLLSALRRSPLARQALVKGNLKAKILIACQGLRGLNTETNKIEGSPTAADKNWQKRCELAACYRILYNLNYHEGVCNHLSASCPASDGSGKVMLVVPYGLAWSEVTASSLIGVSLKDPQNPEVVEPGGGAADISALCIHNGIHHGRPDMTCVLHTHTPNVTALTCLKDPTLQMLHQNSTRFYGEVCYDTEYDGTATCIEEGFRLGKVLKQKSVMMMGNHGVLVLGQTVAEAFDKLFYLERAAEVQILALSTGKELAIIPKKLIEQNKQFHRETMQHYAEAHFNAMRRLVADEKPSYQS